MSAPGRLTFRRGDLAFEADACGAGEPVLLLHGFPDTRATFAGQLPALAAAGYGPVAPTMRGYTPEAQPADGDYHAVRMAEDVVRMAETLGGGVHLVGHDWGATIAFAAAAVAPDRFASLAVLAVPHPVRFAEAYAADPEQQARSAYVLDLLTPDAEARVAADDFAYLEALWRRWSPGWDVSGHALAEVRRAFTEPGVTRAALGWYAQAFDVTSEAGRATQALLAGPFRVPTLGLVGEEDGCIAADVFERAMRPEDFSAGLEVRRVAGAGHFLHREAPDAVNDLLIDWLRRHSAG